jgi:cell division transport system permease protein
VRIGYFVSETITNLKRNFLMTIAAISTVAISLLLLGGVQILGLVVNNVTLTWEAKVEISAFLRDDITENERRDLVQELTTLDAVKEVTYVTKEEAFEIFKARYSDQPEFYETLPEDSLPASLDVSLHDANDAEGVAAGIEGRAGVEDVRFGGEIIKRLLQVNSLLRTITFVMSLILMIAAAALIANTIRVAIYARRDEIGIMKLVGATNWFIRIPFVLEGVFAALVGALVSGAIVIGAQSVLFSRIAHSEDFPFLRPVFNFSSGEIISVLLILVVVGTLVGIIGSFLALRRFLEV